MAESQAPWKPGSEIIDIEKKDGLLEQLNLPPKAIRFIRAYALHLQIGVVVFFVLVGAWSYYDYYTQNKRNEAAQVLAAALMEKDNAGRLQSLAKVADDYSGTGAALWSRIELGNQASRDKKYQEALAFYTEVYEDLPGGSPLRPLLEYALAQNNENAGKLEQAQLYYRKLADHKSFKVIALSAQGRILESKGDKAGALKVYQEAAEDKELSGQSRSILAEKINTLQTASPAKGS